MRDRPDVGGYTSGYVEERLEAAGRTLIALPWAGCFPAGMTCLWPEAGGGEPRRYAVPSSVAISAMSEAYDWMRLITDPDPGQLVMMRRLVLMRSLVLPDSEASKPVYMHTWRDLSRMFDLHRDTLQARWGRGIDAITRRLNRPAVCARLGAAFGQAPSRCKTVTTAATTVWN
jgi:hypothetical protein